MKKIYFLMTALATFLLWSCSEDQSEVSMESFRNSATIQGKVTYSAGVDYVDGKYLVGVTKGAAGKRLVVEVPLSAYGSNNSGVKQFETMVGEDGSFSLSIPVPNSGISNATVRLDDFIETVKTFDKQENGQPVFKETECVFNMSSSVNLRAGGLEIRNFICQSTPIAVADTYKDYVPVKGSVVMQVEREYLRGEYVAAANKNLHLQVAYPDGSSFTFGLTTNASGDFTLNLPVKNSSVAGSYQFNVLPLSFGLEKFAHYEADDSRVLIDGYYQYRAVQTSLYLNGVAGMSYELPTFDLNFIPLETPDQWSWINWERNY